MTSRLKGFRPSPLLAPPDVERELEPWMKVSADDREKLNKLLDSARAGGKGDDVLNVHYHMKMLGVPVEITPLDKRLANERLTHLRGGGNGFTRARDLFYAVKAGFDVEVTDDDRQVMMAEVTAHTGPPNWPNHAELIFYTHGLGENTGLSEDDLTSARSWIDTQFLNHGISASRLMYCLKELGYEFNFPPRCKHMLKIRTNMERGGITVEDYPQMILYANTLFRKKQKPTDDEMPPIKKL